MSVRDLTDAQLACREKHDFQETLFPKRRASWGTPRESICTSCTSARSDLINSLGDVDPSTRKYIYTEMYKEALQYTRQECRLERIRRVRVKQDKLNKRKAAK